ncbi:hypothetical protein SI65_07242 [Aspergillus cristatus]|uniref:Uncharacterized protein n=1 Tax=Aspergillus cristatus TaxID=573508 RepID=A0A1E3B9E5_ASPCR|nr:hypothetical protein SI65_07242 [Aspergillus cristatus]
MNYASRQCEKAAALFYTTNTSTNTSIFNTSSPSSTKHNTTSNDHSPTPGPQTPPLPRPLNNNRDPVLEVLRNHYHDTTVFIDESHGLKITLVNVHHGVMKFVDQVVEQDVDSMTFGTLWMLAAADCAIYDRETLEGKLAHLGLVGEEPVGRWCLESGWVRGPAALFSGLSDEHDMKTDKMMALLDRVAAHAHGRLRLSHPFDAAEVVAWQSGTVNIPFVPSSLSCIFTLPTIIVSTTMTSMKIPSKSSNDTKPVLLPPPLSTKQEIVPVLLENHRPRTKYLSIGSEINSTDATPVRYHSSRDERTRRSCRGDFKASSKDDFSVCEEKMCS